MSNTYVSSLRLPQSYTLSHHDAVDFARERDLDLALVASDYKKAFDQLDRGFLFRTLNRMLGVTQPCANYSRAEMDDQAAQLRAQLADDTSGQLRTQLASLY